MSERKPLSMPFESWIDAQIAAAVKAGAFDNLPGAGKPIPNLGRGYDPDWWIKQLMEREGAHMTPPSLVMRRNVEVELAAIYALDDEATVRGRIAALNAEIAKFNATPIEGPPSTLAVFDIDLVVGRWRQSRAAKSQ